MLRAFPEPLKIIGKSRISCIATWILLILSKCGNITLDDLGNIHTVLDIERPNAVMKFRRTIKLGPLFTMPLVRRTGAPATISAAFGQSAESSHDATGRRKSANRRDVT